MRGLLDKLILLFLSITLLASAQSGIMAVTAMLVMFSVCCIATAFSKMPVRMVLLLGYFVFGCFYPPAALLLPPFVYCFYDGDNKKELIAFAPFAVLLYLAGGSEPLVCVIYFFLACTLCYRRSELEKKDRELKRTRDTGVEKNLLLAERNKHLIERQNAEITNATLTERNRIAREIHDSVGHVLSRSVLQLGAIMAIKKEDEQTMQLLTPLRESLDDAMNSIRKSVHDLRDASVDLHLSADKILEPLRGRCRVNKQFDFTEELDVKTKVCLISVLKEAVTNILRHSDADRLDVSLIEHPAFVQLIIHDNGTVTAKGDGEGMGLTNMRERVKMLEGNINITADNGFRIFITIPKRSGTSGI